MQTETERESGNVAYIIYVQECAICESERGMSDRERGKADSGRSSAWGGSGGQSSTGGMSSGQSRTGGRPGWSQTRTNR